MEHGCRVEQFRVEGQTHSVPRQGSPEVDPDRVMKEQIALAITNELSHFARQFAVGDSYVGNLGYAHNLRSITSCEIQDRRGAFGLAEETLVTALVHSVLLGSAQDGVLPKLGASGSGWSAKTAG